MLKNKQYNRHRRQRLLGKPFVEEIKDHGCRHIKIADLPEYDLTDIGRYSPDV